MIKPSRIRLVSLALALLLCLPLPLGVFTGLFVWLSPFIMLNTLIAQKGFLVFNLLGILVLLLIISKNMFFCRYLCPAGVLCDTASGMARRRNGKIKLPAFGKSIAIFSIILSLFGIPVMIIADPLNIFNAFFDFTHSGLSAGTLLKTSGLLIIVLINLFIPHSWCHKFCPLGGIQFLIADIKLSLKNKEGYSKPAFSRNRRYLLSGILGLGAGILIPRVLKAKPQAVLRPPGSLPGDEMKLICMRCGNCLKACPTNIIQPLTDSGDLMNLFTPLVSFSQSYCLTDCNHCGSVCPTGAIQRFKTEDKHQLFIGTAFVDPGLCLLTQNRECDRCRFYCDYDAVSIANSGNFSVIPVINEEICVGCGACQVACPTRAIVIYPLEPKNQKGMASQVSIS